MEIEYRVVKVYQNGHIWVDRVSDRPDILDALDEPGVVMVMASRKFVNRREEDEDMGERR